MTGSGGAGAPGRAPPDAPFRIDRDGAWRHEGVEVTHPGVLRNLFANLRVEGSAHVLAVGPARIPVAVDDTPFVVLRVEAGATDGPPRAHLTDGSMEPLAVETLELDAAAVPRCRVKDGRFRARLAIAAWLQLAALAEPDARSGGVVLRVGERRIRLPEPGGEARLTGRG